MFTIIISEEMKKDATCRWIINHMGSFAMETGYVPLFDASCVNSDKNLKFFVIPPGKTFEDRVFVGDWANKKIQLHMLDMIADARQNKLGKVEPVPEPKKEVIRISLSQEKFEKIVKNCTPFLLGKMLVVLHHELKQAYLANHAYDVDAAEFVRIRNYARVFTSKKEFRSRQIVANVRTTLLGNYLPILNATAIKLKVNEHVFPEKYQVNLV